MARANKGGEVGRNGEWYKGGTFLPNTELPKMATRTKVAKTRKVQVEPYKWEVAPENFRSIYAEFAGFPKALIENNLSIISEQTIRYYGLDMAKLQELATRYHNGERWY